METRYEDMAVQNIDWKISTVSDNMAVNGKQDMAVQNIDWKIGTSTDLKTRELKTEK